jgi:hypothetical protein
MHEALGSISNTKKKERKKEIRDKKGDITTDSTEIQMITQYFEHLYSNKFEYLQETEAFLDIYNLPKVKQDEINNLKRSITSNEIEAVKQSLPTKKNPGLNRFTAEFYQTFKTRTDTDVLCQELTLKLFHKIETERIYSNSFHKVNITDTKNG